jgi:NO-binding membrane sensor protein with MHYT domain
VANNVPVEISYYFPFILASLFVAMMASYTSLRLISTSDRCSITRRKVRIAEAALMLGAGIWSMHFIGMLAISVPVVLSYDPLLTIGSMLVAIITTEFAFLWLYFRGKTNSSILIAGAFVGVGITAMHYIGMAGMSDNCIRTYGLGGVEIATMVAMATSTLALEFICCDDIRDLKLIQFIAQFFYKTDGEPETAPGWSKYVLLSAAAVIMGSSISAMHYIAMYFTEFSIDLNAKFVATPLISTYDLAIYVTLVSFVICGLFLLSTFPMGQPGVAEMLLNEPELAVAQQVGGFENSAEQSPVKQNEAGGVSPNAPSAHIPFEMNNTQHYCASDQVRSARADGRYCYLSIGDQEVFCSWSISRFEKSVDPDKFVRTHRSHVVNRDEITDFHEDHGKAFCVLGKGKEISVPVSRTNVGKVRMILGFE